MTDHSRTAQEALEARAAELQRASDERKAMVSSGTLKGTVQPGDATPDVLAELATIDLPTLVLVGEEDAPFRKPSARMAEAIPGAELAVIPDVGHSPQFEATDLWWKALTDFLARV